MLTVFYFYLLIVAMEVKEMQDGSKCKHSHGSSELHYHQIVKTINKVRTRNPNHFNVCGVQGHILVSNSKSGWGIGGIYRYLWYVTKHCDGVRSILLYLNDPKQFYFYFGVINGVPASIAGINNTKDLFEGFVAYWLGEKQKEAARSSLRRQPTLTISDANTNDSSIFSLIEYKKNVIMLMMTMIIIATRMYNIDNQQRKCRTKYFKKSTTENNKHINITMSTIYQ